VSPALLLAAAVTLLITLVAYSFLPVTQKFAFSSAHGILFHGLFLVAGAGSVQVSHIRQDPQWFGHLPAPSMMLLKLEEPLVEKPNSYKAVASVVQVYGGGRARTTTGRLIIYFSKDSSLLSLSYGSLLLVKKGLQEIRNSGNPGGFDFKRYALFQGITHQVYLTATDLVVLPQKEPQLWKQFLFESRVFIVDVLRQHISGLREQGLAEALLIGYKDDLDKNLVQAYSNTGVVHVIAISGLHLGIIYWILLFLTKALAAKRTALLRLLLIIAGLWTFSFLAGAQPSVLRSAVMFSAIAWSTVINRKSSIYNTLALSAFVLLCFNPFWLWDLGFQLSYTAVLSILLFYKPIYNWLYFPNKVIDFFWSLAAASLAAQLLTLPISIYYFHQFPLLFLVANLFAVPLSSAILIGELLLCALHFLRPIADLLGRLLQWMIQIMNTSVENLDAVPFAVWNGLSISILQMGVLYAVIAAAAHWLLEKNMTSLRIALAGCLLFSVLRTASFMNAEAQKKIIVYNVSRHPAMDLISGRECMFGGDPELEQNELLRTFHIQPSRIQHRAAPIPGQELPYSFSFGGKSVLRIDSSLRFRKAKLKPPIDLLVLSRNPKVYMVTLANAFAIKQVVIDASVPQWKAKLWEKDCDSLRIACYNVREKGAFVMNLQTTTFAAFYNQVAARPNFFP
jgi:competence protein ComEC